MGVATPQRIQTEQQPLGRYRWTVDSFYRAVDAGVFDEPSRLELLNGDIRIKEKVNPPHAEATEAIMALLRDRLGPDFWIREEKPFHIAFDGEPVPDAYVVKGKPSDFRGRHPRTEEVALAIEIVDSSEDRDTGEKAALYGKAGLADYWVSLVNKSELCVYRNPTEEGYSKPLKLNASDTVSPLCAPGIVLSVNDLLWHP